MSRHYSDPEREEETYALPDIEVFYVDDLGRVDGEPFVLPHGPGDEAEGLAEEGYYYWYCFPGCMPDSEPIGPFLSVEDAIKDARESAGEYGVDDDDIEED